MLTKSKKGSMPELTLTTNHRNGGAPNTKRAGRAADPMRMFALSMIRRAIDDAADGDTQAARWIRDGDCGQITFLNACKAARISPDRVRQRLQRRTGTVSLVDAKKIDDLKRLEEDRYKWVTCSEAAERFPFTSRRIAEVASKDPSVTGIKAPRSKDTNRLCRYIRLDWSTRQRFSSNKCN